MLRDIAPGYLDIHSDISFNYQLNRWLPFIPESLLREMASKIHVVSDFKEVFYAAAKTSEKQEKDPIQTAFLYRGAEFFATNGEAIKEESYEKFVSFFESGFSPNTYTRQEVKYENGKLPVYIVEPEGGVANDTLLVHGGFDSFAEELLPHLSTIRKHGIRIVLFEGPGQGVALRTYGLPMTPDWHRPVGVVLDALNIDSCTLMGISLGGCLAIRAAAYEKRIKRVIANDIAEDFFDIICSRLGPAKRQLISSLIDKKLSFIVNSLFKKAMQKDETLEWALNHGMHVSGTSSAYDYLLWTKTITTKNISQFVTQDVMLLAGQDDHLIPLEQFYTQQASLTSACSITTRLFTSVEHASNHCHVGNFEISMDTIQNWILMHISNEVGESISSKSKEVSDV